MIVTGIVAGVGVVGLLVLLYMIVTVIPNDRVGIVEKLWSSTGSLNDGEIIALNNEAGYQIFILRGGVRLWWWGWQYHIHKDSLVEIKQGKIGYVFARAGKQMPAGQTLAKVIDCNNFQDARKFLEGGGEKGRQRGILREGVYAINTALFTVITEDRIYGLDINRKEVDQWQRALRECDGFDPVVITGKTDQIAIVTVHDGPALPPGELVAPAVGTEKDQEHYHNNYQDPEAFLAAGGRRGLQYMPLIDGTYFINRWFATVEYIDKTTVPIGYVGVVVSYYGKKGTDTSGTTFRHGERVHEGEKGVWDAALGPGKYAFNTYAGEVVLVPTTNFVLHWITGRSEKHKFDDNLTSIELITADAYEPMLPLSVVVHIDYQKAPSVIQRFGDVKQLITQTLDPLLSAYFRDVAHKKSMLQLIHDRDEIQKQAREELRAKFAQFDIECVDCLIGRPESKEGDTKIESLLEQLRQRQFAIEQVATFQKKEEAAVREKSMNEAVAKAELQAKLTQSQVQIQISQNTGDADLAKARKTSEQQVVMAEAAAKQSALQGEGEAKRILAMAEAQAKQISLIGDAEGQKVLAIGNAEAEVLEKKVTSYGDPKLYAVSLVADSLSHSQQPLVPSQMFVTGGEGGGGAMSMLGTLLTMLAAEKVGIELKKPAKRRTAMLEGTSMAQEEPSDA